MKRHLIMMVHGIGEQVPGDTVDEFAGAARAELDLEAPVDSAKVMLSDVHDQGDQHKLFPCHTRRLHAKNGDELLLAEVHWADLSRAPKGMIATAFDLMHVVLGLGYIALDNVEKNSAFDHPWIARMVHLFVWLFYSVIVPMNGILFLGAIALLVDPYLVDLGTDGVSPAWVMLGVGIVAAVFAGFMRSRVSTYLTRSFRKGVEVMGLITIFLSFVAISQIGVEGLGLFTSHCAVVAPPLSEENLETLRGNNALSCYVGTAVMVLNGAGLLAVILLLLMAFGSFVVMIRTWWEGVKPSPFRDFGRKRAIYLAVCAAQMVFTTFFIIGFWVVFADTVDRLEGTEPILLGQVLERHFGLATRTFGYIFVALVMVVIAAVVLGLRRVIEAGRQRRLGVAEPNFDRLILSAAINWGLTAAIFLIAAGSLHAYASWTLQYVEPTDAAPQDILRAIQDRLEVLHYWIEPIARWALLGVGALMLLMLNNSTVVAAVLGVARDIVVYSTRTHAKAPDEDAGNYSRYLLREQIECRFDAVVAAFAAPGQWDSITIASHSQGTVVASRGLRRLQALDPKPSLITMGSPLGHIYCHYFDHEFASKAPMRDKLRGWINVFRCDDYVGTAINGYDELICNAPPVRAAGHRHYWTDRHVWAALKQCQKEQPDFELPGFRNVLSQKGKQIASESAAVENRLSRASF